VLLTHGEVHRYRVVVEDDGVGFSTDNLPVDGSGHFGLSIMRERAEAIDADLRIESENSEGTQVILEFSGPGCD
jgi:two-component system nitrate/nitrite sensor histidine kinase NarX